MAKRISIGNLVLTGFVNMVDAGKRRATIGSGSYKDASNNTVFKQSITVFADAKFDGVLPAKGDYVKVRGTDMSITAREDKLVALIGADAAALVSENLSDLLNVTYNVRFKDQLEQQEKPVARSAAAAPDADI